MNCKMEYQKPVTILIELECESLIAGSNGLANDSGKETPGVSSGNSMAGSIKIDLSDED